MGIRSCNSIVGKKLMRNKPITPAVLDALNRWYATERLSQEQIARIAGVNRSSVNAWLSGEARAIRAVNWSRMLPHLRQYLPPEEVAADDIGIVPEGERLVEEFRRRIQDAVMSSDLDDAAKVKVFGMIRAVPVPLKFKNG